MKIIVLGMLLAVVQAAPPVPRHTSNEANKSGQSVKKQSDNKEAPSPSSSSFQEIVKPKAQSNSADAPSSPNTQQSITINKLPTVSVEKDLMDKTAWLFSGLLIVIGVAGVCAAVKTLKTIKRQAELMEGQLTTMQGQFGQMQKQAAEMEKQTRHLEGSVAATQASAEAAKLAADIAARVSIPRLVIEKFEPADAGAANLAAMLQYPNVKIVIKNYGQTPALLKFWIIIFTCEELPAEPDYWNDRGSRIILERDVIEPNQPYTIPPIPSWKRAELSLKDVEAIIKHEKKLWAYGFICYDDIFGSARWRMKFCEFALNVRKGWIQWESSFSPPVYRDTEEFPWGLPASKGREADNSHEAEQPND
jgi:hypothetical protein